jgi:Ran GTPase-activating protein (RanGAP) involved in mRNA processing and transport
MDQSIATPPTPITAIEQNLPIENIRITNEIFMRFGAARLATFFQQNNSLEIVHLTGGLGATGGLGGSENDLRTLIRGLAANQSVQNIYFSDMNMDDNKLHLFGDLIRNSRSSIGFFLENNDHEISYASTRHLIACIRSNPRIQSLGFTNCTMDPHFVREFTRYVGTNRSLTDISITDCHIGTAGITQLATALRTNQTLTTLVLNNVGVTDEGMRNLCAAMAINTTISELTLDNNEITDASVNYICDMIENHPALTELCLEDLSLNQATCDMIEDIANAVDLLVFLPS